MTATDAHAAARTRDTWRWPLGAWALGAATSVAVRIVAGGSPWMVEQWSDHVQGDAHTYLDAARHPAPVVSDAVLPVYPALVRALTWTTGDVVNTAVLVAYLSGAAFAWLVWTWLSDQVEDGTALRWGFAALLAFPGSFVLYGVAGPLVPALAAAVASLHLARRGWTAAAVVVATVAVLTDATALAVLPALGVVVADRDGDRRSWRGVVAASLPVLVAFGVLAAGRAPGVPFSRGSLPALDVLLEGRLRWLAVALWPFADLRWYVVVDRWAQVAVLALVAWAALRWRSVLGVFGTTLVASSVLVAVLAAADSVALLRHCLLAFPLAAPVGVVLARRAAGGRVPRAAALATVGLGALWSVATYGLYVRGVVLPRW